MFGFAQLLFFYCQLSATFTTSMNTMGKWLLAVLFGMTLSACHDKQAADAAHGRHVTDQKGLTDMAGTWYATAETNALLDKKKYVRDSVYLILQADSAFHVRLPDCLDAAAKGGLIWDAIGAWRLHKNGETWKLGMAFEKGRLFRYRTFTDFDIRVLDSVLILSRYIGNPDEGEILTFRKKQ
jgi:hypothetical protein